MAFIKRLQRPSWGLAFFISIIVVLFYLPIVNNGFVNWDDPVAILENHHLYSLNFSFFQWMLTSFHTGNWIPLTWLSLALDHALGNLNPKIYHLHNLLLHTINTLLVFFLSFKVLNLAFGAKEKEVKGITVEYLAAALTALLFGLHPIHVESVAWAAERKDLLCGLFFFASLLVYLNNVSSQSEKSWKWTVCGAFFVLSLLAKPMAITLPFVLLLLDIWPLKRFHSFFPKMLFEKIPFFIFSLAITLVTILAQSKANAISDTAQLPVDFRIMNAFHSLVFYLQKMFLPMNLVPFYPLGFQSWESFSSANLIAFLVIFVISMVCYYCRKTAPYITVAWLYYVITLIPVLGLIQVGSQAAADRYTYIPSWSLFLLFSASLTFYLSKRRVILTSVSAILILTLGFATVNQIDIWKNSISLWESVLKIYPSTSVVIHTNMANAYKQFGQLDKALKEYDRALAVGNPHAYIYDGKGMVLLDKGLIDQAIEAFYQAIHLDPNYASPHRNLWFAYEKKGLHELALAEILEAIRIQPDFVQAYNNLGISYGYKGEFEKSIEAFKAAFAINPYDSTSLVNLATTFQRSGQFDAAIEWYKKGIYLNAREPIYFINLAHTYLLKGMLAEAIEILHTAIHLQSPHAEIFQKLGNVYEKIGNLELAKQNYERAMQLRENRVKQ